MKTLLLFSLLTVGCANEPPLRSAPLEGCWRSSTEELDLFVGGEYVHTLHGASYDGSWTLDGTTDHLRLIGADAGGAGPYETIEDLTASELTITSGTFARVTCSNEETNK